MCWTRGAISTESVKLKGPESGGRSVVFWLRTAPEIKFFAGVSQVNPSLPVPPYFDHLIEAFYEGGTGRHVHLGHWDNPPPLSQPPVPGEFEKAQARLNAVLLEMADLGNGQRVLDVGCGFAMR